MSRRNWCLNCFRIKGDYEVCPYCGYVEGTCSTGTYQLIPGTVLHRRYIIGAVIGLGGFGITYKAYDAMEGRIVAVKECYPSGMVNRAQGETRVGVFSGEKAEAFRKVKQRFLEEAQNMAVFARDREIVNEYDFFEENGTAYLIMEYIEGKLLKKELKRRGKFPLEEACGYMMSILGALTRIHENGIVHRDISPDNIFLMGDGRVKIFDFGAAWFRDRKESQLPSAVVKAGYAPPEQYLMKGEANPRMDLYAAGAVFYEMVTGQKPLESLDRMDQDDLKRPSELGVETDPAIEAAIMKALSLKAQDRFASARDFAMSILKR